MDKVADIFVHELKFPKILAELYDLPSSVVDELGSDLSNLQM